MKHVISVSGECSLGLTYAHAAPRMLTLVASARPVPRTVIVVPPSTGPTLGETSVIVGGA